MATGASEVTNKDIAPTARALPTLPFDVLAIPAITLWGPINVAQAVVDFDDYLEKYHGYILGRQSALQVRQAFLGGTRKAVVNRIVHINPTTGVPVTAAKATSMLQTGATAATAASVLGSVVGPFALTPGDTLIGNVEAAGNQTATFNATAGGLENTPAETYALADGQTLLVKVDGGGVQTITFNTAEFASIGAATAEEVAAVINAEIVGASAVATSAGTKVTITSDKKGTGSSIEVTGGTANGVLTFAAGVNSGTGNVADIEAVTVAEIKSIVEAAWTNGSGVTVTDTAGAVFIATNLTGATATLVVDATSTADDELGLDNATHTGTSGVAQNTLQLRGKYEGGTVGNALTADVVAASNEKAEFFDLVIYLGGAEREVWTNMTMDAANADGLYVVDFLATNSKLVEGVDQSATGTALQVRPANVVGAVFAGGDDGLDALDDNDFIGSAGPKTGLFAFNLLVDGDILICPDRPTTTLQNAASNYCETDKKNTMIFIPDPAPGLDEDGAITHVESLTPSEQATALPWPYIKEPNPDRAIFGPDDEIEIAPSGSIAGRMARNSRRYIEGAFKQPGNEIFGRLVNVTNVVDTAVNDINVRRKITPARINPIVAMKDTEGAFGVWLNDVQALKTTGNWKSIGEIRGVSLLRKTIMAYMETTRTQGNTEDSRLRDQKQVEAYLLTWAAREVFVSKNAAEAFYVNTDVGGTGINNPVEQEKERYRIIVAVATARSKRFIDINFTRDQRAIENFIQQQLTAP